MAFLAFFILGIITYMNIPITLLPDIAIPEITIQVTGENTSARELENTAVSRIRQQLLQVGKLRDIRSETRDGSAVIQLSFEYGANTDLAFIEVNEKIDAAMSSLPKGMERPRVIKASATDIPVFNLALTLRSDSSFEETDMGRFIELSDFAETVIRRRFEQLPQIAMIDMSGLIKKQIVITPDKKLLETSGITLSDLESALNNNNIEPGSMVIRDGYLEYAIRFSSVLRTVQDIEDIYVRKNDRIYQLKDLATVELLPRQESGMTLYQGKRAVVLSVIKQSEENMGNMQRATAEVVEQFRKDFPEVEFHVTQNQTELLDYTISNLLQNLVLAFIFVCMVSFLFLNDGKSPIIIGLSMFVSLVISLLFFYLCHITLNVVSLTGLVLALGMMIDNSIIVTDNIGQHRINGEPLDKACIRGTGEVMAPMLSSSLTTISVFVPLIFLSGIAGALFFDQAFSVTVGLLVSYVTGVVLLPVLYKWIYSTRLPRLFTRKNKQEVDTEQLRHSLIFRIYDAGIHWIFRHKISTLLLMLTVFPLCFLLFVLIPKEKMPDINQNEMLAHIEWNENVHIQENYERSMELSRFLAPLSEEASCLVGQQQFMLNRERYMSGSETELYVRTRNQREIDELKTRMGAYLKEKYPEALLTFTPAGTIFEKIFTTGEADLVIEYYAVDKSRKPGPETIENLSRDIERHTGEKPVSVSFRHQLNLRIDKEKLILYNVSFDAVYRVLRTALKENRVATLRSQQEFLPIVLGEEGQDIRKIIDETLVNVSADKEGRVSKVALSTFVQTSPASDLKSIIAGKSGEYIPFSFHETDRAEQILTAAQGMNLDKAGEWEVDFSGSYFTNRKMIGEMVIILLISILLMYFILVSQFEDFRQPLIVLLEIPIDVAAALGLLMLAGHTLNLMSAIGIVVTCGIIINDSILKVDIMNQLRKEGMSIMEAIHEAGQRRLKAILMTSLTSIVCMAPLLISNDLGSQLEKPLAIATIGGMVIGTPVSLFVVPLAYWWIYRKEEKTSNKTIRNEQDK